MPSRAQDWRIWQGLPLRTLDLSRCEAITDGGLAHLARLAALQTLNLGDCKAITDGGPAHLAGLAALQTLTLTRCDAITDTGALAWDHAPIVQNDPWLNQHAFSGPALVQDVQNDLLLSDF